jgi:hypothetical protein
MKTAIILLFFSLSLFADQSGTPMSQPAPATNRWSNYSRDAFLSPGAFFASVLPAANEHRTNRPPEYGQGWDAFGERLGRRAAQYQVQMALLHSSAAALRTETQYRTCNCDGAWRRMRYAVSRIAVTRTDSGATIVNAPVLGAYLGGGMIATSWYPDRYSPWREGLRTGGTQLGGRAALNVVKEFAPELKRFFRIGR